MLDKTDDHLFPGIKQMKNFFSRHQNTSSSQNNNEIIGGSLGLIQHTRPSNLPAKNPAEEMQHRKQHDEILEKARKIDERVKKKNNELREINIKKEDKLLCNSATWNNLIIPNFNNLRYKKNVYDLWWCGLPPSIRGRVWKLSINNTLNLTVDIYNECETKIINFADNKLHNDYLTAIKLDVSRTFPNLCLFQSNGPLNESLNSVLSAYCVLRPDVGYLQGMSFIAAILTLNMDKCDAFICFSNLIDNPCHKAAFTLNQNKMNVYYNLFMKLLSINIPIIHKHFLNSGLSPDFYLLDWIYTIYSKAMPLDIVCRIWDVFIRDGDEFLFKTAIGILNIYQRQLLNMDFVRGAQFLKKLPDNLCADELFDSIKQININIDGNNFQKMVDESL